MKTKISLIAVLAVVGSDVAQAKTFRTRYTVPLTQLTAGTLRLSCASYGADYFLSSNNHPGGVFTPRISETTLNLVANNQDQTSANYVCYKFAVQSEQAAACPELPKELKPGGIYAAYANGASWDYAAKAGRGQKDECYLNWSPSPLSVTPIPYPVADGLPHRAGKSGAFPAIDPFSINSYSESCAATSPQGKLQCIHDHQDANYDVKAANSALTTNFTNYYNLKIAQRPKVACATGYTFVANGGNDGADKCVKQTVPADAKDPVSTLTLPTYSVPVPVAVGTN